ncbi:hypothetical protein V2I01_00845 [Micromonospora sp. BRA006-A]|nr:hypothetical protein [Micromonospora sp. BRA006-A]
MAPERGPGRESRSPRPHRRERRRLSDLDASGHLDDTRWDDDLLFDEGLDGILRTAARTGTPE